MTETPGSGSSDVAQRDAARAIANQRRTARKQQARGLLGRRRRDEAAAAVVMTAQPQIVKLTDNGKRRFLLTVECAGITVEVVVPDGNKLAGDSVDVAEWVDGITS